MRPLCSYGEAIRDKLWGHHASIKAAIDLRVNFTLFLSLTKYVMCYSILVYIIVTTDCNNDVFCLNRCP